MTDEKHVIATPSVRKLQSLTDPENQIPLRKEFHGIVKTFHNSQTMTQQIKSKKTICVHLSQKTKKWKNAWHVIANERKRVKQSLTYSPIQHSSFNINNSSFICG
jgi:wyosine [tRNA(Phe)-imidazoG37] synthetase (radical SAM superfamily)